jgi:hypothetical protein
MMSAQEYRLLMTKIGETEARQQAVLSKLTARFDETLSSLQAPDTAKKVDDLFAAKGQATVRPIAGATF